MASQVITRVADFSRSLGRVDRKSISVNQWVNLGPLTSTSVANGFYSFSTVFTDLPDSSNYGGAFDMYRIDSLEYHVIACSQPSAPASAAGYSFLYVYHDYDDATAPAALSNALSSQNLTICGPGERHSRKIKPHVAVATTTSAAAAINGAKNMVADWMDMASSSVPHYGLKAIVTQSTSTNVNTWNLFVRITATLRYQQ